MGFFSIEPQIHIRFRRSITHDLLTMVALLSSAERVEGLTDWVQNTAGRVAAHNLHVLDAIATLFRFANGLHGYMVDSLSEGERATQFSLMMDALEMLDPTELQKLAVEAIRASAIRRGVVPADWPALKTETMVLDMLRKMAAVQEDESLHPLTSLEQIAALVMDGEALLEQFLFAFEYIWHRLYSARWQEDAYQEEVALHYHQNQDYPADIETVFGAVTGRTLPEELQKHLSSIRHVDFIPCCHIGAYVVISIWRDKMWIGFNANLIAQDISDNTVASLAEIYPMLKALADEDRLKIIHYLQMHGERNVGEIAEDLHFTLPTASRHLKLLRRTNILHIRRDGTMRYYALNPHSLLNLGKHLQQLGEQALYSLGYREE